MGLNEVWNFLQYRSREPSSRHFGAISERLSRQLRGRLSIRIFHRCLRRRLEEACLRDVSKIDRQSTVSQHVHCPSQCWAVSFRTERATVGSSPVSLTYIRRTLMDPFWGSWMVSYMVTFTSQYAGYATDSCRVDVDLVSTEYRIRVGRSAESMFDLRCREVR